MTSGGRCVSLEIVPLLRGTHLITPLETRKRSKLGTENSDARSSTLDEAVPRGIFLAHSGLQSPGAHYILLFSLLSSRMKPAQTTFKNSSGSQEVHTN